MEDAGFVNEVFQGEGREGGEGDVLVQIGGCLTADAFSEGGGGTGFSDRETVVCEACFDGEIGVNVAHVASCC